MLEFSHRSKGWSPAFNWQAVFSLLWKIPCAWILVTFLSHWLSWGRSRNNTFAEPASSSQLGELRSQPSPAGPPLFMKRSRCHVRPIKWVLLRFVPASASSALAVLVYGSQSSHISNDQPPAINLFLVLLYNYTFATEYVSVPKITSNMCFAMAATHRLRTAILDQQAENVSVTINSRLLSEPG